jgi:hypothetical protein
MNTAATTLPGLLLERERSMPQTTALRFHDLGIWSPQSWGELAGSVRTAGNALAKLGVQRGAAVALAAQNTPTWIVADLAVQGLAATTVALHPELSPAAVSTMLAGRAAAFAIAGDQEQYDKLVGSGALVDDALIVVVNTRGLRHFDRTAQPLRVPASDAVVTTHRALSWNALLALGDSTADLWTQQAAALETSAPITVEGHVHGAAGAARTLRPATATSSDLLSAADDLISRLGAHAGDELHPIVSFADPLERALSEVLALRVGAVLNIGEGGALQDQEATAVQPTIAHVGSQRLRDIRADVERRRPRRGLRRIAIDRLLNGSGATSRTARLDLAVTAAALVTLAFASAIVHRLLVDRNGLLRLAVIAVLGAVVLALLLFGGYGVRPFIRKAYGLGRAHSLLTGPDVDDATVRFLGALKLTPILEHRSSGDTPAAPAPVDDSPSGMASR